MFLLVLLVHLTRFAKHERFVDKTCFATHVNKLSKILIEGGIFEYLASPSYETFL